MRTAEPSPPSGSSHESMLIRAVVASTVGTAIEWYDFFLYSTVTGLVFAKEFFPASDPLVGTLQAFLIYAVGFAARPVGAAIFGHYGDRMGRKAALVSTLLLMGIATLLVAFVPNYAKIGVWGAVILTILRFVQGVGVGGEWGGSVLLAMEWAKTHGNRGFIAAWPQFGVPAGLFLANLAVLIFSAISGSQFHDWGWRVPFLLSGILVVIGLWIRLGILETPTFQRLVQENKIEKAPAVEVLKRQPKSVVLSALVRLTEQTPFYIFTAFIFSYGAGYLKVSRELLLNAVLAFAVLEFITIPLAGHLSDRIGRKRMYLIGAGANIVVSFVFFWLLNTVDVTAIFAAVLLAALAHSAVYGPQAALIAEQFTPRMRYSGASLGYQLASIIAGGPAPLIATWLLATYHSGMAVSVYMAICACIGFVATLFMTEYSRTDISEEYKHVGGSRFEPQSRTGRGA
ncbi:MAG: MHS family MFS transporter [Verrucomicrobia bacterium]|nr:MHS family MFS transporter [Verrucomicrobiota bacterium]